MEENWEKIFRTIKYPIELSFNQFFIEIKSLKNINETFVFLTYEDYDDDSECNIDFDDTYHCEKVSDSKYEFKGFFVLNDTFTSESITIESID